MSHLSTIKASFRGQLQSEVWKSTFSSRAIDEKVLCDKLSSHVVSTLCVLSIFGTSNVFAAPVEITSPAFSYTRTEAQDLFLSDPDGQFDFTIVESPGNLDQSLKSESPNALSEIRLNAGVPDIGVRAVAGDVSDFPIDQGPIAATAVTTGVIWDQITFNFADTSEKSVDFELNFDGSLQVTDPLGSLAYYFGGFGIYDITEMPDAIFFEYEDTNAALIGTNALDSTPALAGAAFLRGVVSTEDILDSLELDPAFPNFPFEVDQEFFVDGSGQVFDVAGSLADTFVAEEGRIYAIAITVTAAASGRGGSRVDAFNTVSVGVSGVANSEFSTASGMLFAAPVPVPAAAPLMLAGLGLFAAKRRRNTAA